MLTGLDVLNNILKFSSGINFEPAVDPGLTLSVNIFMFSLSVNPPNLYANCTVSFF